jgi:hypothetical protein
VTKADRIRELDAKGLSPSAIARAIYSIPKDAGTKDVDRKAAYVRVVLRQRVGGGCSIHDKNYYLWHGDKRRALARERFHKRYWSDPEFRAKHLAKEAKRRRRIAAAKARAA